MLNLEGMDSDNRLGEFLRARRELARPEAHGMPAAGRRRTPRQGSSCPRSKYAASSGSIGGTSYGMPPSRSDIVAM